MKKACEYMPRRLSVVRHFHSTAGHGTAEAQFGLDGRIFDEPLNKEHSISKWIKESAHSIVAEYGDGRSVRGICNAKRRAILCLVHLYSRKRFENACPYVPYPWSDDRFIMGENNGEMIQDAHT